MGAADVSTSGNLHETNAYLLLYERLAGPTDHRAPEPSTVPPSSTSWLEVNNSERKNSSGSSSSSSSNNNHSDGNTNTAPPATPKRQHLAGSGAAAAAASPAAVAASVFAGATPSPPPDLNSRGGADGGARAESLATTAVPRGEADRDQGANAELGAADADGDNDGGPAREAREGSASSVKQLASEPGGRAAAVAVAAAAAAAAGEGRAGRGHSRGSGRTPGHQSMDWSWSSEFGTK